MQKTEHLELNLFENDDAVLAESFNHNTRTLDGAVAGKLGGMIFTYTGDGAASRTVTFSKTPLFVAIAAADEGDYHLCLTARGASRAGYHTAGEAYPGTVPVSWDGNALTITGTGENLTTRSKRACNTAGRLYRCVAFTA